MTVEQALGGALVTALVTDLLLDPLVLPFDVNLQVGLAGVTFSTCVTRKAFLLRLRTTALNIRAGAAGLAAIFGQPTLFVRLVFQSSHGDRRREACLHFGRGHFHVAGNVALQNRVYFSAQIYPIFCCCRTRKAII